jgi:hypothetical protein
MALSDERETCRIDGRHLEELVEISIPNKLAHVVKRRHEAFIPPRKPVPPPPQQLASGSQPIPPLRDDDPELTIVEQDTAAPIDQIAEHEHELAPVQEQQVAPPPPRLDRARRDAILGGAIGVALLLASWLVSASF